MRRISFRSVSPSTKIHKFCKLVARAIRLKGNQTAGAYCLEGFTLHLLDHVRERFRLSKSYKLSLRLTLGKPKPDGTDTDEFVVYDSQSYVAFKAWATNQTDRVRGRGLYHCDCLSAQNLVVLSLC